MRTIILRNIQGRKVFVLFCISTILYMLMICITIPSVQQHSPGYKIPDLMPFGYGLDYVRTLFDLLGKSGREAYLLIQIPVDLIYPLIFGVSSCLILAYLNAKIGIHHTVWFYLCYLPLMAALFDYAENVGIITMLTDYPHFSTTVYRITNFCTIVKSFCTSCYFIILGWLLIWLLVKNINKSKSCSTKT